MCNEAWGIGGRLAMAAIQSRKDWLLHGCMVGRPVRHNNGVSCQDSNGFQ